ncbi:MAG: hypothetical protein JKY23_03445 [Nitrospinaceae bacterium]|nr:hypothetical protein [Nitrospinaceae bacterium]
MKKLLAMFGIIIFHKRNRIEHKRQSVIEALKRECNFKGPRRRFIA